MKILILGVNGFIGSHLTERVLAETDWQIYGMDLTSDKIENLTDNKNFHFLEGDISINHEWIAYHINKCDVCLPLVAIATPASYLKDPLAVFQLDFEENLRIVKQCNKFNTRVIFPSTSEVYGMCSDEKFSETESTFVYGAIHKQRWIYACAKQLLDRVIWAMGIHNNLRFTIIRPFNWIGPRLDNINVAKEGSSRVVTQFLGHMLRGEDIYLVDGGSQRRSFTYINDGIDALLKIIENKNNACDGKIFNLGNPDNDISIRELAELMFKILREFPQFSNKKMKSKIIEIPAKEYYGDGYEDMKRRTPDISKVCNLLDWRPKVALEEALRETIKCYVTNSSFNLPIMLGGKKA